MVLTTGDKIISDFVVTSFGHADFVDETVLL